MPRDKISKPGAVGQNMSAALKGDVQGYISSNYHGRPANAIPNFPHNPQNSRPVKDYAVEYMQSRRDEEGAKRYFARVFDNINKR